ncbi:rootletin-like [Leptidea sinapis]|uniref:Uncharacterized protein n=1 Tax=Leptidea sinapis TaxID=189913 RepID=A0A5E4QFV2_9NEOP|nr:rootletin-like [Leptidea sinapis]VVC97165.1 unnamed protein product [Leptidea sinapis]
MAAYNSFEDLDEEVKELLENYKHRKATVYEPCTTKNFKECLVGLSEELSLFNISYIFNPHVDVIENTIYPDALINLVNAAWALLHHHKNVIQKADSLKERNHTLEQNNKQINGALQKFKDKLNNEKNESRACVASAQRVSDQSNEVYQKLSETRNKLNQVLKQKETNEKVLQYKITKLKLENEKLTDRLRNKSSGYTPCAEICDSTIVQLKERERKQRQVISQLQSSNQELIREVLAIKEEVLLAGLSDVHLKD